ncbi:MAG: TnpV protein [Ruminococcus sp.]|nr:TnpV protein [Ruminococcus sp.]
MKVSAQITYTQIGDYKYPNLTAPTHNKPIGKYGRLRRTYLMNEKPCRYSMMLIKGQILQHLSEIDEQAREQVKELTEAMAQDNGVNEELKATDPMKWTGLMNSIRHSAEEIVLRELVYS